MDNGQPQSELELDGPPDARFVELFRRTAPDLTLDLEEIVRDPGAFKPAERLSSPEHGGRWWAWAATIAAVSVLAALGVWMSISSPRVLLGQVGDELRRVASYRCSLSFSRSKVTGGRTESATIYWSAPRSYRNDTSRDGKLISSTIHPSDKPGIEINYATKTFSRLPTDHETVSGLMLMQKLADFRGAADRDLGKSQIGGVEVQGFEIAARKVDANNLAEGKVRIWADVRTRLPVKVEMDLVPGMPVVEVQDFAWNEPSEKWFETTPPLGFREAKRSTPAPAAMVEKIALAMRIYAKYSGGHYPQVKRVYGDFLMAELRKLAGVDRVLAPSKMSDKQMKAYVECNEASWGLAYLTMLPRENADTAYYGLTVGPADKDKVLCYWKLDSGEYMVIYGDLRHETVSGPRLQALKPK